MAHKTERRQAFLDSEVQPEDGAESPATKEVLRSLRSGSRVSGDVLRAAIGVNLYLDTILRCPYLDRSKTSQVIDDLELPRSFTQVAVYSFPASEGRMMWAVAKAPNGGVYARGENGVVYHANTRNQKSITNMLANMKKSSAD